jgi:hypothetical protein
VSLPRVELYTDGACSGNPGPGGWAFLLRHPASGKSIERAGAEMETTNNRMELKAVIEGLSALKSRSHVDLTSDSASDIHLIAGHPPVMRVHQVMTPMEFPVILTPEIARKFFEQMASKERRRL